MGTFSDYESHVHEHFKEKRKLNICAWLTDTHFVPGTRMREKVVEEVLDHNPSYVFIGGDISAVGGRWVVEDIKALSEAFKEIPIYYVLGNHDLWGWKKKDLEESLLRLSISKKNLHRLDDTAIGDTIITTSDDRRILIRGESGWYDGWPDGAPKWLDNLFLDTHFSLDVKEAGSSRRRQLHNELRNSGMITKEMNESVDEAVILTHFPPWGQLLVEDEKYPILSRCMKIYDANVQLGKEIEKWHKNARKENNRFLTRVYCGHTHIPADERICDGLYARVGKSGVNLFVL